MAIISGTYTCSDGDFVGITVDVSQAVGRFSILGSGEFFDSGTCDGTPHTWSATVYPENGRFAGGKAKIVVYGYACGSFECGYGYAEQRVQLRGRK